MQRRQLLLGSAALFAPLGTFAQSAATSGTWPTRPIRLLVGFAGGTTPDMVARALAEPLSKALGQPVIVENKPGASGNIVADQVAKATDDHTLGVLINGNLTSAKMLYSRLPYDPARDFSYLSLLTTAPLVLVAPAALPGAAAFLAEASKQGSAWNYGSVSVGSLGHLGMELLKSKTPGLRAVHVPFSGPQLITALLDGQIQMALSAPGSVIAHIKSGKLKAIGLSSGRSPLVPDVPPLADIGVKDFELEIWTALLGPANLSKGAQIRLVSEVQRIFGTDDARQKLLSQGWKAVGTSPEGLIQRVKQETASMSQIIQVTVPSLIDDLKNSNMNDQLLAYEMAAMLPQLSGIRRDIHKHPEMGMEEVRTAAIVAKLLREWGLEVTEHVGKTGVVGTLRGVRSGSRAIGLRADMDALPIVEKTGLPYASIHHGTMHACGHDGHTTMLLGAANYLAKHPDFSGIVHFIFQPAEEGRGGAAAMIADKLFERFPCDAVYGMHNQPGASLGTFATCVGAAMAAVGEFRVTFGGQGGHGGAAPHLAADLTVAMSQFILGLQVIVGRNVPPTEKAVISVGHVAGGSPDASNVMPAKVQVTGTVRCHSPPVQKLLEDRIAHLAKSIAVTNECTVTCDLSWLIPALINHAEQAEIAIKAAQKVAGIDNVNRQRKPSFGGEDFAEMALVVPGAYVFMGNGCGTPENPAVFAHTAHYDFNDDAIPFGVRYWLNILSLELGTP